MYCDAKYRRIEKSAIFRLTADEGAVACDQPVYVLPADQYEAMVEQMAKAMNPNLWKAILNLEKRMRAGDPSPWHDFRVEYRDQARAALKAIGIEEKL